MPTRPLLSIFLLVLLLLSGLGLPTGLVMCYGADGHVAIEVAGDSDCSGLIQKIDYSQDHQFVAERHCGQCTDIPLMFQASETVSSVQASFSADTQPVYIATSWEVLPSLFLKTATETQLPHPPPILDPFLKAHRTVVLVI